MDIAELYDVIPSVAETLPAAQRDELLQLREQLSEAGPVLWCQRLEGFAQRALNSRVGNRRSLMMLMQAAQTHQPLDQKAILLAVPLVLLFILAVGMSG